MLVVGLPEFIVNDKAVFKRQEIQTWEKQSKVKTYVDEMIENTKEYLKDYNIN